MPWEAKPLPYKSLDGLSEQQISEHYKLYEKYIAKQNELHQMYRKVNWSQEIAGANPSYSPSREMKIEETFTLNAIKLHEAYFFGMGGNGKPAGKAQDLITMDYGSVDEFQAEMMACGLNARGWVVGCFDWNYGCMNTVVCDAHNMYGLWNSSPLIVLDCYEHAYFADYATNRKSYVEAWWKNLNWDFINKIIEDYNIMEFHQEHRAA